MTNRNVPSGSQPPAQRDAAPPVAARTTRLLRIEHPPGVNSLIRLGQVGARAAPRDAPSTFPAAASYNGQSTSGSPMRSADLYVAALCDAAIDIATAAPHARTRTLCSASAVRSPDRRYAGMTPRHNRISFIANERLIEKLVHATALLSGQDDELSIDEVLEFAVDSLICACRGG